MRIIARGLEQPVRRTRRRRRRPQRHERRPAIEADATAWRRGDSAARAARRSLHPGVEETAEITLTFDDNRLAGLVFGQYDQNLAHLERRLGVVANANGNHVIVKGAPEALRTGAPGPGEPLRARPATATSLTLGDVDGAIQESACQGTLFPAEEAPGRSVFEQIATRKRGPVRARNAAQDAYIRR